MTKKQFQTPRRFGYRRIFLTVAIALAGCMCLEVQTASADEIHLKNGGLLEGRLVEQKEEDGRTIYVLELNSGAVLTIDGTNVRRLVEEPAEMAEYLTRKEATPDTVDGHWEIAEFCREHRTLKEERTYHLWQIVRLDSDHPEARRGLGFTKHGDRWMTQDQFMQSQGYIRVRGDWRLPLEVALEESGGNTEELVIQWRRNLTAWMDWLGRRKQDEALANFRNVRDPLAIGPLGELLAKATQRPEKMLLIETLEQIQDHGVVVPLSNQVLTDNDDDIRERCLRIIKAREDEAGGQTLTARFFMGHLDPAENSPAVINRAGRALQVLEAEEAVRSLIEALITEHKTKIGGNSGGGQSINFGSGGPNGGLGSFQVGGDGPKEITRYSENSGVLAALSEITEANYGFDKERWLSWYVGQRSNPDVDLRRGIE